MQSVVVRVRHRVGDHVFVRAYAGPVIRVTVTKELDGSFEGTVHPDDDRKLYLAGVPECPPGYIGIFHDHRVVTRKDFEEEDWRLWIVRTEKKPNKK